MTNDNDPNEMTLADAHAWLRSISYDQKWTNDQLIAAVAHLPRADLDAIFKALTIVAEAAAREADELEAYVANRQRSAPAA